MSLGQRFSDHAEHTADFVEFLGLAGSGQAEASSLNRVICRVRIVVEHAVAGVKRCRIVADTFRNWRKNPVDEVMLAAYGLHNLRESCRATC